MIYFGVNFGAELAESFYMWMLFCGVAMFFMCIWLTTRVVIGGGEREVDLIEKRFAAVFFFFFFLFLFGQSRLKEYAATQPRYGYAWDESEGVLYDRKGNVLQVEQIAVNNGSDEMRYDKKTATLLTPGTVEVKEGEDTTGAWLMFVCIFSAFWLKLLEAVVNECSEHGVEQGLKRCKEEPLFWFCFVALGVVIAGIWAVVLYCGF